MFVVFPDGEAAKGWFEGNVWPDGRRPRNQIGGSPRNNHVEPCKIVDWVASETSITCSLNFGGAGVAPGPTISQTFTYGVTTDKDDVYIALKAYRDAMDCSGDPGKINEIIQGAADDWRPAGFAGVTLNTGSDEHAPKLDTTSDTPVPADRGDVPPLYAGNGDLAICGAMAAGNLPLGIKYDTMPNASRGAVPKPTCRCFFNIFYRTAAPRGPPYTIHRARAACARGPSRRRVWPPRAVSYGAGSDPGPGPDMCRMRGGGRPLRCLPHMAGPPNVHSSPRFWCSSKTGGATSLDHRPYCRVMRFCGSYQPCGTASRST